jgi:hypothetical protein
MIAVCLWSLASVTNRASAHETRVRSAVSSATSAYKVCMSEDGDEDSQRADDGAPSDTTSETDGPDEGHDAVLFPQGHSPSSGGDAFTRSAPRGTRLSARVPVASVP